MSKEKKELQTLIPIIGSLPCLSVNLMWDVRVSRSCGKRSPELKNSGFAWSIKGAAILVTVNRFRLGWSTFPKPTRRAVHELNKAIDRADGYCNDFPCADDIEEPPQKKSLLAATTSRIPPERDLPISWNIAPTQDVLVIRFNRVTKQRALTTPDPSGGT